MSILYTATVTVSSGTLNVRKEASKTAAIVGRLNKGKTVDVIEEVDGWLKIISGTLTGWCDGSYMTKAVTAEETDTFTTIITDSEGNTFKPIGTFTVKVVTA